MLIKRETVGRGWLLVFQDPEGPLCFGKGLSPQLPPGKPLVKPYGPLPEGSIFCVFRFELVIISTLGNRDCEAKK